MGKLSPGSFTQCKILHPEWIGPPKWTKEESKWYFPAQIHNFSGPDILPHLIKHRNALGLYYLNIRHNHPSKAMKYSTSFCFNKQSISMAARLIKWHWLPLLQYWNITSIPMTWNYSKTLRYCRLITLLLDRSRHILWNGGIAFQNIVVQL